MTHRGPVQPLPFCDSVILSTCEPECPAWIFHGERPRCLGVNAYVFIAIFPCVNRGQSEVKGRKTDECLAVQPRRWSGLRSFGALMCSEMPADENAGVVSARMIPAILHAMHAPPMYLYRVYLLNHRCPCRCINSYGKNCFVTHGIQLHHLWGCWRQSRALEDWQWDSKTVVRAVTASRAVDAFRLLLLGAGERLSFCVCVALHTLCSFSVTGSEVLNCNKPSCHLTNKNGWFAEALSASWLRGKWVFLKLDKSHLTF